AAPAAGGGGRARRRDDVDRRQLDRDRGPYGAGSSVAQFVERFGGGMHSVAVQVHDLAATLRRVEPLGVEVAARIGPEIVFTRPGATAGLLLEWGSHVQEDDPRFGAPLLPFVRPPVVNIER